MTASGSKTLWFKNKKAAKDFIKNNSLAARLAYKTTTSVLNRMQGLFYVASWLCAPRFPVVCSEQSHAV